MTTFSTHNPHALPQELARAVDSLLALFDDYPANQSTSPTVERLRLLDYLHNIADRRGLELADSEWKKACHYHPPASARFFLNQAFPKHRFCPPTHRAIIIVPGGHCSRIEPRFTIARDVLNYLQKRDEEAVALINILGYRPLQDDELLQPLDYPWPNTATSQCNEIDFWQHQHPLITKHYRIPSDSLLAITSHIHPILYPEGHLPQRATTLDNAAALAKWASKALSDGQIQATDTFVLCIEEPFSRRMALIFKTLLGWYLPNPVHVYHGRAYCPSVALYPTFHDRVDLSCPINQLYLTLKIHIASEQGVFLPSKPLLSELSDLH